MPDLLRGALALPMALLLLSHTLSAQDASQAAPPPKAGAVRITFLPPPIEGTISVGIHDKAGKLIRLLHRESNVADFTTGLNGLITSWDGKDDSGNAVPNGKYRVRGSAVGDLEIVGEAFHCNDWVASEDGPRPVRFHRIGIEGGDPFLVGTDLAGLSWKFKHSLADGSITCEPLGDPRQTAPVQPEPTSCAGQNKSRWSIEKALGEPLVVQFDAHGEVAKRLAIGAGEPAPVAIAASQEKDELFLLENSGDRWRLRGLRKKSASGPPPTAPAWEIFIEKNLWPSSKFSAVAERVGRQKPFPDSSKVTIKTQPNPLTPESSHSLEIAAGFDSEGSFLKTADGLSLRRLTDTRNLQWALLGYESNQPELVLLQSDGAVVEEYRIRKPSRILSFDAGEYPWPPK